MKYFEIVAYPLFEILSAGRVVREKCSSCGRVFIKSQEELAVEIGNVSPVPDAVSSLVCDEWAASKSLLKFLRAYPGVNLRYVPMTDRRGRSLRFTQLLPADSMDIGVGSIRRQGCWECGHGMEFKLAPLFLKSTVHSFPVIAVVRQSGLIVVAREDLVNGIQDAGFDVDFREALFDGQQEPSLTKWTMPGVDWSEM